VLTDAIILDLQGKTFATTGISMNSEDAQNLKEFFEQKINTSLYLKLGDYKYRIFHFEQNKLAYISYGAVGGTIAKSNTLYIIGFFNGNKIYTCDGKKKNQCQVMCNTVVEELANELKDVGF